jgi:hypothetical protein
MNTQLLDLTAMCAEQVAAMNTAELAELDGAVDEQSKDIKQIKSLLDKAKEIKFGPQAEEERRKQGKPTGTIQIDDGAYVIVNIVQKKPEWNQEKLAAISKEMHRDGVDPSNYLDTEFKIQERRYTAWPPHIQDVFASARTLNVSKPTYRIEVKGGK